MILSDIFTLWPCGDAWQPPPAVLTLILSGGHAPHQGHPGGLTSSSIYMSPIKDFPPLPGGGLSGGVKLKRGPRAPRVSPLEGEEGPCEKHRERVVLWGQAGLLRGFCWTVWGRHPEAAAPGSAHSAVHGEHPRARRQGTKEAGAAPRSSTAARPAGWLGRRARRARRPQTGGGLIFEGTPG